MRPQAWSSPSPGETGAAAHRMVEMKRLPVSGDLVNRTRYAAARLLALTTLIVPPAGGVAAAAPQSDDIDAFMEKVLERRVTNWEDLYHYTVRDREAIEITGPGGEKIESQVGEYTWYVREGYMVRSPDTLNGAKVGAKEREKAEQEFLERARARDEERARNEGEPGKDVSVEREYFLGFPFEAGNYLLVGFEDLEGREVARVEYYPEEFFEDDGDEDDAEMMRSFQKTSRVTLWILVEEYQIVKVAWDSLNFDFLPCRWLVQVDDVQAELIMHRPFPDDDVWLPREILLKGGLTVATGSYSLSYTLEYFDYKETDVAAKVRFRFPGVEQHDE